MFYVGRGLRSVFVIASAVLLAPPLTAGVRVQPMSYDLSTAGNGARKDLRVENTSATPAAVEIRVERREVQPDGSDKRTPADDDFLIFPPQGTVPGNGFQTFRIQYVGDPLLKQSRLYLVTIAQLPVSATGQAGTGIQIVYNIGTLAAVSPAGAVARMEVIAVRPAVDPGFIEVTVHNAGNRYARLRNGSWLLTSGDGKTETLEGEPLRKAIDNSLIEADGTRIVRLPVSANFRREGAKASFKLALS
ncbi:molecular chaperone [Sphingomonas sp. NBWT7]|uniref:fimbrial biogenesis chaperone n=1 Tax=Sphingomonas sp. NBWT7 TaxID=2596913 RepID=UPI0016234B82|nr:fimbria/pilus periplasmic chaperone [Sphingomonas sp. NBWT7]QNE32428.1 molecular chaperone [Sphingomonas sp. NBWT7]